MKILSQVFVLVSVAAGPAVIAIAVHPQLANYRRAGLEEGAVRLAEVREWHEEVLWIDARSKTEFVRDHIPGAISLDETDFDRGLGAILAAWTPGRRVVVYCSTSACHTSHAVAERLRAAGLNDVFFLHGGWDSWQLTARK